MYGQNKRPNYFCNFVRFFGNFVAKAIRKTAPKSKYLPVSCALDINISGASVSGAPRSGHIYLFSDTCTGKLVKPVMCPRSCVRSHLFSKVNIFCSTFVQVGECRRKYLLLRFFLDK